MAMTNIEMQAANAVCSINKKLKDQNTVDWQQRRYEAAKDILAGLCSNPNIKAELSFEEMAGKAVMLADILCEKLRATSK